MLRSGMQNRKRIVVRKPKMPVKNALLKSPLAATTLQANLSRGSEYTQLNLPGILGFFGDMARGIESGHGSSRE